MSNPSSMPQVTPSPSSSASTLVLDQYWTKHSRSGGAYLPPHRAIHRTIPTDKSSEAFQRLSWEALRKSINGLVNKVNTSNIKEILMELFEENLVRGRGVLVRSLMRAQTQAISFTAVYAALISVVNTKIPMVGELLLQRLVLGFRKAYRRNDKTNCISYTLFIAHLTNQRVVHEIVSLEILLLLLEKPTDDSVEIAIGLMRECGITLSEVSPKPYNAVFERFRVILHEGGSSNQNENNREKLSEANVRAREGKKNEEISKRTQYMIEVLFQLRKDKFKDNIAIKPELDLVDEEDQMIHYLRLDDDKLDSQDKLNIFSYDPEFVKNEEEYSEIKTEILGKEEDRQSFYQNENDDQENEQRDQQLVSTQSSSSIPSLSIRDESGKDIVQLRKTIYLTIMSCVDMEECCHKLLKLNISEGQELELCNMIIECCSQERAYLKYYGLLAERFCRLNPVWQQIFELSFRDLLSTIHRLETGRIRNLAKLYAHLLYTDAVDWPTFFSPVKLTEEDTTSASRIFIKFLFQDLIEFLGAQKLIERFFTDYEGERRKESRIGKEDERKESKEETRLEMRGRKDFYGNNQRGNYPFEGIFPFHGELRNIRFVINYFTAFGLGTLTDRLREIVMKQNEEEDEYYSD